MAKTFDKLVYSLIEVATSFTPTDDTEYPVKWVEDAVISVHNSIMRESHARQKFGPELLQLHKEVEIKPYNSSISKNGLTIKTKTDLCYADIPEIVSGIEQIPLTYVGTIDLQSGFSYTNVDELGRGRKSVWELPKPLYSIFSNKILIESKGPATPKFISVMAYFKDPRDVNTYDPEAVFPTPSEYKLEMLGLQHIMHAKGMPQDLINDAQRALGQPAKPRGDDDN